jgi:hypothetical protein
MTSQARDGACAFAWRNYLQLHSGVSENDTVRPLPLHHQSLRYGWIWFRSVADSGSRLLEKAGRIA